MKKILALILIFFTLTACESTNTAEPSEMPDKAPAVTDIRDLPEDYGTYGETDDAIDDGVVVIEHNETHNADKLESFLKNAADGKTAFVRTIAYTVEGAPIITDYEYDGEKYIMTYDNSRDKFSNGGSITTSYYSNIVLCNDRLYFYNWSGILDIAPPSLDAYPLNTVSDDVKVLFDPSDSTLTGVFYSPDSKHRLTVTEGSLSFTAEVGDTVHKLTMPEGAVPTEAYWQDEKNALIIGHANDTTLYLPVNTETGEVGNWEEMTFYDYNEIHEQAWRILDHNNWFGPGMRVDQITEPFEVTAPGVSGSTTVSLQYRTVVQLNYTRPDLDVDAKLYFDWFTGEYLGQVGVLNGEPYDLSDITREDKIYSTVSMELDSCNIDTDADTLTLSFGNPYQEDLHVTCWAIDRYSHGYWYAMKWLCRDVGLILAPSGTSSLCIELPKMDAGYYRVALCFSKDGKAYVSYCPFTVGSVSDFEPADLPKSDREVIDDRGVGIDLLRDAVPDDEIIMYKVTAEDDSDEFHTGCGAYLEVLIDDTWCVLPDRVIGFDAVGMTIGGEKRETYESLTITDYLLPLEEGHYRILKDGYFEKGHDVYIAGEFDVVDGSVSDYEVSAPEGLVLEAIGASEPNPDGTVKRGWANYFQLDVAITNGSDVVVIPDAMTALTKGSYDGTAHEHYRTMPPGESFATKLQMVTADHNGNLIYADDSGLFNADGSMNDGTYKISRRVFFPDGRWCMVYGEFEVAGGELVKASPQGEGFSVSK